MFYVSVIVFNSLYRGLDVMFFADESIIASNLGLLILNCLRIDRAVVAKLLMTVLSVRRIVAEVTGMTLPML